MTDIRQNITNNAGWNTWNTMNVLSYSHLPDGFTISLCIRDYREAKVLRMIRRYDWKTWDDVREGCVAAVNGERREYARMANLFRFKASLNTQRIRKQLKYGGDRGRDGGTAAVGCRT